MVGTASVASQDASASASPTASASGTARSKVVASTGASERVGGTSSGTGMCRAMTSRNAKNFSVGHPASSRGAS